MADIDAWDALAAGGWKDSHEQRWFHDFILYPAMCDRLPAGLRLLDFGCGSGEFLAFAEARGHEVIGYDPSKEMVRRATKQNPNVCIVNRLIELGDFECGAVVVNLVLSCLEDPIGVLSAASRYARKVIVSVPHPCFSLFGDLHKTTRRQWLSSHAVHDERELYFSEPQQAVIWNEAGLSTRLYHRSIEGWVKIFGRSGLGVHCIKEPLPVAEGIMCPDLFARFSCIPAFMIFDLQR